MRHVRAFSLAGIALLFAMALASACGTSERSATAAPPVATATARATAPSAVSSTTAPSGSFRFAYGAVTGFALLPGMIAGKIFIDPMYDPLVGLDDSRQPVGTSGFVSAWTSSPDGLAWTFKTRPGVGFHDGSAARANDLKFSLDWYAGPKSVAYASNSAARARVLKQVDVLDESTAVASLRTPDLFFVVDQLSLGGNSRSGGYLLPQAYMEARGFEEANRRPVGSGPLKYRSDTPNLAVEFEAAAPAHWFYGAPKYATAQMLFMPDDATRTALIKDGRVQGGIVTRAASEGLRRDGFDMVTNPDERFAYLDMVEQYTAAFPNYGRNPLADVRVRQALSLAIDREYLSRELFRGLVTPTLSMLPPREPAYTASAAPKADLVQAKRLITEAGFAGGFALDLLILRSIPGMEEGPQAQELIAGWWEQLGVKINRKPLAHITFVGQAENGKSFGVPTVVGVWWGAPSSPFNGMPPNSALTSLGYSGNPGVHMTEDRDLEMLSVQLPQAKTLEEYVRLAQRSAALMQERVTVLPLGYGGAVYAVQPGYGGKEWRLGKQTFSLNLAALMTGRVQVVR